MNQENKTVFKDPQTGSNGTPQSRKISRSKQHFQLKTIKHFEKKLSIDDISEKEGFVYLDFASTQLLRPRVVKRNFSQKSATVRM